MPEPPSPPARLPAPGPAAVRPPGRLLRQPDPRLALRTRAERGMERSLRRADRDDRGDQVDAA